MYLHIHLHLHPHTAFSISIEFPFKDNALINENVGMARITQIHVDSTSVRTYGHISVTVQIMNTGYVGHEFSIKISKCPVTCAATVKQSTRISPYSMATNKFNLTFVPMEWVKKHTCEGKLFYV